MGKVKAVKAWGWMNKNGQLCGGSTESRRWAMDIRGEFRVVPVLITPARSGAGKRKQPPNPDGRR